MGISKNSSLVKNFDNLKAFIWKMKDQENMVNWKSHLICPLLWLKWKQ